MLSICQLFKFPSNKIQVIQQHGHEFSSFCCVYLIEVKKVCLSDLDGVSYRLSGLMQCQCRRQDEVVIVTEAWSLAYNFFILCGIKSNQIEFTQTI